MIATGSQATAPDDPPSERVAHALGALSRGEPVVVLDDDGPSNQGPELAVVACAAGLRPFAGARLMRHGGGILTVAMPAQRLHELGFRDGETVGARSQVAGGVSASDRAAACRAAADPALAGTDLMRPGHVFLKGTAEGGVLNRAGVEEAAVDLMGLAGAPPAAVYCPLLREDGEAATRADLEQIAGDLAMLSVDDVLAHRLANGRIVHCVVKTPLPTTFGSFTAHGYECSVDLGEHMALTMGQIDDRPILTRVHRACSFGEVFGSSCDCGDKLDRSLEMIARAGRGVLVYVRQPEKTEARLAHSAARMDVREVGLGAQILTDLGVRQMRLITSSRTSYPHLAVFGLTVVERVPLRVSPGTGS